MHMNFKSERKILFFLLFCLFSFLGGALNGFVGTGGGIVFIFMLSALTKNEKKDNYVTTLFAVVPISLIGSFSYFYGGSVDISILQGAYLPAILGGALGVFLVDKLKVRWLNLLFGLLIIYSGASMLFRQ